MPRISSNLNQDVRGVLVGSEVIAIHKTHNMEYAPCLHLECTNCWLSVSNNAIELPFPCVNDVFYLD